MTAISTSKSIFLLSGSNWVSFVRLDHHHLRKDGRSLLLLQQLLDQDRFQPEAAEVFLRIILDEHYQKFKEEDSSSLQQATILYCLFPIKTSYKIHLKTTRFDASNSSKDSKSKVHQWLFISRETTELYLPPMASFIHSIKTLISTSMKMTY
jgi:hypothetical protein